MAEIILGIVFLIGGIVALALAFIGGLMASHPTGRTPGQTPPWRPVWIFGLAGVACIALSLFLFFGG